MPHNFAADSFDTKKL